MEHANDTKFEIMMLMLDRGEIIISMVRGIGNWYELNMPALVAHERPQSGILGFMLCAWLPNEILVFPNITIPHSRITGRLNPSPELSSFYTTWARAEVDKLNYYKKDFSSQVGAIEKMFTDRILDTKRRRIIHGTHDEETKDELLREVFTEDSEWGNSGTTH